MDERDVIEEIQEGRGRSAKKREAKAIEELARTLVEMPEADISKLPLEGALRRELDAARTTKGHSSRRRQIKRFAGCLRRDEEGRSALEAFFDGVQIERAREAQNFHRLEEYRDRLCDPTASADTLTEIQDAFPLINTKRLQSLVASVHTHQDKKASREIFRILRKAEEDQATDA